MIKKIVLANFIYFILLGLSSRDCFAVSVNSAAITAKASINSSLTLDVVVEDQLSSAITPSLDFGNLIRVNDEFRSQTFYKVYLTINSVGDPCELSQLGTFLSRTGGGEIIPSGVYIVKPEYDAGQNSSKAQPAGSQVGSRGTAVGTRVLFTDPTGSDRTITATYTLSGDSNLGATETIPLSQKSGSYNGTIQYTLTTI